MSTAIAIDGPHLTFGGVLNSEWIKLRTLRSTFWCYVIIVLLTVLLGLLVANVIPAPQESIPHDSQQALWVRATTLGIQFGQLVIAVLGALVITGEYSTGMIRSTFAAVPGRISAMFAKVIVFGVTTFVIGFASLVLTALVTAPLLSGKGVHADFGDPQVWLRLVGGAAYLVLIGLISFGIGLIIRNSAGSIAAALGLVLVVPIILSIIAGLARAQWVTDLSAFLPSSAGGKLFAYPDAAEGTNTSGIDLTTWQSLLVVLAWFAVTFVVGLVLLKRRDA